LINERADIAAGAGAAGVHLTTRSLDASIIRKSFGDEFLIGVSTHSEEEARAARDQSADFIVFGPVFSTPSKERFGPPLGLHKLRDLTSSLAGFPVLALGGISVKNAKQCFQVGASGIAGINLFSDPDQLAKVAERVREDSKDVAH
jgi:thiamine-phosphate pyrophosphorylase